MSVTRTLRGMRDRSQTVSNAMTDFEFKFRRAVLPLRRRLSGVSEGRSRGVHASRFVLAVCAVIEGGSSEVKKT